MATFSHNQQIESRQYTNEVGNPSHFPSAPVLPGPMRVYCGHCEDWVVTVTSPKPSALTTLLSMSIYLLANGMLSVGLALVFLTAFRVIANLSTGCGYPIFLDIAFLSGTLAAGLGFWVLGQRLSRKVPEVELLFQDVLHHCPRPYCNLNLAEYKSDKLSQGIIGPIKFVAGILVETKPIKTEHNLHVNTEHGINFGEWNPTLRIKPEPIYAHVDPIQFRADGGFHNSLDIAARGGFHNTIQTNSKVSTDHRVKVCAIM